MKNTENVRNAVLDMFLIILTDPIAKRVRSFMEEQEEWTGSTVRIYAVTYAATDLFETGGARHQKQVLYQSRHKAVRP